MQMVFTIGVAIYLGWLLDNYLEFQFPVFMLTFMLLATWGVFFALYKSLQKDNKDK